MSEPDDALELHEVPDTDDDTDDDGVDEAPPFPDEPGELG